jgi:hypothetical protein
MLRSRIGRIAPGFGQRAAVSRDFLGSQVADERVALADELFGAQVEDVEVVRRVP